MGKKFDPVIGYIYVLEKTNTPYVTGVNRVINVRKNKPTKANQDVFSKTIKQDVRIEKVIISYAGETP